MQHGNTKEFTHRTVGNNDPIKVKEVVKGKRRARRRWQRTRDPSDKTVFNIKTQQLKREIQKLNKISINIDLRDLTAEKNTDNFL